MNLTAQSDEELLGGLDRLCGSQREVTARLVEYLAEVESRRLDLRAGFSSMFDFCVKRLRLSEGEAFRRIVAARAVRRFPVVASFIRSGAVHLSALKLLAQHLTEANHEELLTAASGKSKRAVEELVATRFPKADVPSRIRPGSLIEALSAKRFRVEFTASAELRDKLELARDLLSHANPSRDLSVVVERAVDLLLAELEKTRLAKTKRPHREPRNRAREATTARRVPNAVRRAVFERDGCQCTYTSADGRQCGARSFLELDHIHPKALGGSDEVTNLRVRCRAHNRLWAEQAFGRRHVERCLDLRQEKSKDAELVSNEKIAQLTRSADDEHQPPAASLSIAVDELLDLELVDETAASLALAQVDSCNPPFTQPPPSLPNPTTPINAATR